MKQPLLSVENLKVTYRSHDGAMMAVRGIDFTIAEQESLAIVGESGCGKTSVALAMMGLLDGRQTAVSGKARLRGDDLLSMSPRAMRDVRGGRIGMIFQDPMTSLNPYLRVGIQIREPIEVHRNMAGAASRAEAAELLHSVGFDAPASRHLRRYPHEFSGGMCQRAMIASALACSPDLLIADEPTTALDVITQNQVLQLMERKRREHKMALLLITHDLGIVAAVADRVAVMYQGEIVEQGSVEQIYGDPQHDYTRALLSAVPRLDRPRRRRLRTVADNKQSVAECAPAEKPVPSECNVIRVENVVVDFRQNPAAPWQKATTVRAVDDVSLELKRGESFGLVGQSGSGKSTLIRAILRLVPITSGHIHFRETEITTCGRREMRALWRTMQMVFQNPYGSLNSRMTIGQAIAQPLQHFGVVGRAERREEVERLLDLVQIDPAWRGRFPHELSGGQRQRVAIARALAPRPDILFCDEPVSALDVSIQAEILNLLADLRQQLGLTLFFISHDLAVVRHVADRVGVMHEGRIVDMLSADDIGKRAGHPYTEELLAAVPVPDPVARRTREMRHA